MRIYRCQEQQGKAAEPPGELDCLASPPAFALGCYDLWRHRAILSHCGENKIARMAVEIESYHLCAAKIVAGETAFDHRGQAHSLCSGGEEFENDGDNPQVNDSEVGRTLDQLVPRYRHGGESDFGVVNVCDCRNPEKVTGLVGRLVDSFLHLDDHQIYKMRQ